jgi:hypothetical protein
MADYKTILIAFRETLEKGKGQNLKRFVIEQRLNFPDRKAIFPML